MEPENTPLGRGKSSSKPSFSGSTLIFGGVTQLELKILLRPSVPALNGPPGSFFTLRPLKRTKNLSSKRTHKLDGSEAVKGLHPMITTWSTSGNPGVASSLPEVTQKKNDLILLIASGPLVRSFRFSGVSLENGEKMMKEKIHTIFTQPKEQPWLHCLQPPVFGFYVLCFWGPVILNLSFGDFGCLETCTRSNNTYPPKDTVPPEIRVEEGQQSREWFS